MSANKRSAFLTESSNIDDRIEKENTQSEIKQTPVSNEDDEYYSENEINQNGHDDDEDDEDDDDDDDFNPDSYPNPFLQQFHNSFDNQNMIREEGDNDLNRYEENIRPISALAPKIFQQDDVQVEVSSTPAFQCLEEVKILYSIFNIKFN
jgi:hypothetical protein